MERAAIRAARAEDQSGYVDLREDVAAEGQWIGAEAPIDREAAARAFAEALEAPGQLVLVAEAGGRIVGYLGAEERRGLIELGMFVAATHRGSGIGRALLEHCLAWARGRGAHKIALQVWPHNEPAIRLYEGYGFAIEGRLRGHYKRRSGEIWDALLMGLRVR